MPLQMQPHEQEEIISLLKKEIPHHHVMVFGSRANGTARASSDLDLLILGEPLSFETMAKLKIAFSESDLPYFVDLVEDASIDNAFKEHIETECIPLV